MRRTIQMAMTAGIAAVLVGAGASVATAADTTAGVDAYSVPDSEAATTTTWDADRMEAAIPGDVLVADLTDEIEPASAVDAGAPVEVAGATPNGNGNGQGNGNGNGNGNGGEQATEVPVSHIGKVFFTLGGVDYVCSANAVVSANESTVATAGHCLNEGPGEFATEFVFVPAYENGEAPYGQWPATDLVTTTQWADQGDINYDTGFAVLQSPTGTSLSDTVGASGVAFNQDRGLDYSLYGYPAAAPFDGETLQSCAGWSFDDSWGGTQSQGVDCDMTGGSSGGPWFIGSGSAGTQNSVNSFGYNGLDDVMFGPYWGSDIQEAYEAAQA